jgi:hypothetical protein
MVLTTQTMKELTINKAFSHIDSLLNKAAIDFVPTIPEKASKGELYVVVHNNSSQLALLNDDGNWKTWNAACNIILFVFKPNAFFRFDGQKWHKITP